MLCLYTKARKMIRGKKGQVVMVKKVGWHDFFSSDPAVTSSTFVGAEREENWINPWKVDGELADTTISSLR